MKENESSSIGGGALRLKFLDLLEAMDLIVVNRVDERLNGRAAGSSSDLVSSNIQFMSNDDFEKLIKFIETEPEKTKKALISGGGFEEKK